MRKFLNFFVLAAIAAAPLSARANMDEGLYDPVPPEGSAFVRFLNVAQAPGSEAVSADGKVYDHLDYKEISPYFVVAKGDVVLKGGNAQIDSVVEEGHFYTVVLKAPGKLSLHEDAAQTDRSKSQILLYNYGPSPVSLKTDDGKIGIIEDVAAKQVKARDINPVKVSLAIYSGDKKIRDLDAVAFERSQAYSAIVLPDGDAFWTRSQTNTTR